MVDVGCLDNDALLGFVEGGLSPEQMQSVEEHIDRCADCRRLASELADLLVSAGGQEDDLTTRPLEREAPTAGGELDRMATGSLVDHYRVLGLIGRGGMGEVYLAEDTQLQRRVALKLIRNDLLGSRKMVERFLFEARATARFSHPNIVGIYGVGEHAGRPYLALEFIEGRPLRQVMAGLPARGAAQIALGIAEALQEAHRHGILHRDLKPANVIIGADGRARVLDFGIAKALPGGRAADGELSEVEAVPGGAMSATAGLLGTPGYVAPEQWRGEPATGAGDVWSLGMILYELFVGFHPHRGDADRGVPPVTPGDEITHCVPSDGAVIELAAVAAACLAPEPERRPPLPSVAQALRRWLRRNDTVAVRSVRRPRLAAILGGAMGVALLAGGLVWTLGAGQDPSSGQGGVRPGSGDATAGEVRPDTAPVAVVPRPDVARTTAADALETGGPAVERAAISSRRKRVRRTSRRKKRARRKPKKPEPINLDAPFPPR
jgi:tRNA A-37 threonylcarbamoyl transferase component Bud32